MLSSLLGLVQAGIGGIEPGARGRWVASSATGLAVGLGLGASAVGFGTNTASLVAMGAISGGAVGLAQAWSMRMRAFDRLLWVVATPALWAIGWLITSQVIVDADRHHAVFGSSGALVVSAAAGLLHVARQRQAQVAPAVLAGASLRSAVAR